MRRALLILLASCIQYREIGANFGEAGEGLDGFLCKDPAGKMLLDRLGPDAGLAPASLVTDFIDMQGLPGCRTGQLIRWCGTHSCKPIAQTRQCTTIQLPSGVTGLAREDVRTSIRAQLDSLKGTSIIGVAPPQGAILRVLATSQSCDEVMADTAAFDPAKLVGCAYSCPTEFNRIDQDVYLGFETLTAACEQGVRICGAGELKWMP
jgi:hypothetical protein